MAQSTIRDDLEFLVNNPDKTLASKYHDAGSCWRLIEAAVDEIRRLREKLQNSSEDMKSGGAARDYG